MIRSIGTALIALVLGAQGYSQSATRVAPDNIFEALEAERAGEGFVVIDQPTNLYELVGRSSTKHSAILGREGNTTLMMGYRLQFYSSNQGNAKAVVKQREAQIRALAPEYNCYVQYNAPFWRLLVGDFRTQSEAREAQRKLQELLPAWAKDSYIVPDKVRVLNYNTQDLSDY